jgi:acyl-CoA dehydrogenase
MPSYRAPVEDVQFLLRDVFRIERYNNLPGFADVTPDTLDAILGEAARLCEDELQPLNRAGDLEGCRREADGAVHTPQGFSKGYDAFAQGGWIGLAADPEYGGQGLPYALGAVVNEFSSSANMALAMYPGLTMGAIAALHRHGSPEQKALYLPRLISGEWTGTMNLT